MKNILLVTQGFPFGNSERGFLETEYKYLVEKANVHIVAVTDMEVTSNEQAVVFRDNSTGITKLIFQLKYKDVIEDIRMACKSETLNNRITRIKRILSYSARADHIEKVLEKIINDKKIDIVYTYWCLPATLAACRMKSKYNIKVITRFHGFDLYKFRDYSGWQPLRQFITQKIDLLIFACEEGKKYYLKEICECPEKTHVSLLGTLNYKQLETKKTSTLKIISCSNIIPLKRVDMIAKVIYQLAKTIDVEWYHIGGPLQKYKILDNHGIKYHIYGEIEHNKIQKLYEEIKPDIFITLSTTEGGAPISIQEAMSMGIPIIATDVGGISEIVIDQYNGILLSENADELTVYNKLVWFNSLGDKERKIMSMNSLKIWHEKCDANLNAHRFVDKILKL